MTRMIGKADFMGILNRFFLLLASLALLAVSLAVLAVALHLFPENYWHNQLMFAVARPETVAIAIVALLISLHLFFVSFSRHRPKQATSKGEFLIVDGAFGEVRVALPAISGLVEKLVTEVHGVRDVKVRTTASRDPKEERPLRIALSLAVGRESNVETVSSTAIGRIRQQLEKTMGLADVPVTVDVTAITNAAPDKKRRVV